MSWKELFPKGNRYFETDRGILYCGDCLVVMRKFPRESIDLVLTDPPYGVRKKEKWDERKYFLDMISEWINSCYEVTKMVVLWFCADKMLPYILRGNEDRFHRLLVWDKPEGSQFAGGMHTNIWYSIEPILVFAKNLPKTNRKKRYGYACFNYRTIPEKECGHPTTKPLELVKELIYFYSDENDLVLDPFLGSGTTALACEKLNRRWIGIEISEEYCEIASKRLDAIKFMKERPEKKKMGFFV